MIRNVLFDLVAPGLEVVAALLGAEFGTAFGAVAFGAGAFVQGVDGLDNCREALALVQVQEACHCAFVGEEVVDWVPDQGDILQVAGHSLDWDQVAQGLWEEAVADSLLEAGFRDSARVATEGARDVAVV